MTRKSINMALYLGVACFVALLSQYTGYWVNNNIDINTTLELNSLIHLTHIRNYGGVFGFAQGMGWLFALISVALLLGVTLYLWLGKHVQRHEFVCFGFIVGGGISNILDRLLYGSVIDFIDIQHIPYWNYVFNVADVMVHVGVWPLLLLSLFVSHHQAEESRKS
ncbi:MAG: signal peptidase II [Pseudohongiellaceae bacterium]